MQRGTRRPRIARITIVFLGCPLEPKKDSAAAPIYSGARQLRIDLFQQLVNSEIVERSIVACQTKDVPLIEKRLGEYKQELKNSVQVSNYHSLKNLDSERVVIQELSSYLSVAVHLRHICEKSWPI